VKTSTPVAILDANVLFPFTLRDTLLRASAAGLYQVRWSDEILTEVTRNLVAKGRIAEAQAKSLRRAMEAAFPDAMVAGYQHRIRDMRNDSKDRHVAAAAVQGGATVIVTQNLPDFRELPTSLAAVSPDRFLCDLHGSAPKAMREAIQAQAAALRSPPRTPADIVRGLSTVVPRFAALIGPTVNGE